MPTNDHTTLAPFRTVEAIKTANRDSGGYWFHRSNLRLFGSRVGSTVYGGFLFVSSELDFHGGDRRATINMATPAGYIGKVGPWRHFATTAAANRTAARIAYLAPALVAIDLVAAADCPGVRTAAATAIQEAVLDGWRPAASELLALANPAVLDFLAARLRDGVALPDALRVALRVADLSGVAAA